MLNANKILDACNKAYNKGRGGNVQDAIDTAIKMGVKSYAHCSGCFASQPTIKNTCCVCGMQTEYHVTKKEMLVDEVIKEIKKDIRDGDLESLCELLKAVPMKNLQAYLPEKL